jgi:5-methyltetrahydrofolate--homocysteine methyltransferase
VSIPRAVAGLEDAGADVVGSNCGTGIEAMLSIARELARATRLPIVIQPNAGLPESVDGHTVYRETPESMAARVPELLESGVAIVGGCCGTTPDHTRALRAAVDAWRARASRA